MKSFRVFPVKRVYLMGYIDAESESEAIKKARNAKLEDYAEVIDEEIVEFNISEFKREETKSVYGVGK